MTITRKVSIATVTAAIGLGTVITGASGVVSLAQSSDTAVEAQSGRPRPVPPGGDPRGLSRAQVPEHANPPEPGEVNVGPGNRNQ
ncbi:hypothetical protein QFZ22_000663 [Streptomyces canus]|uniref:Uncharacterized protein n=1 Tax=Streptomyces canus TaxID=58343 RepID=A0AAW8F4F8_9ACTN|nr:hypothetical protein [Streptomyces canus]